MVLQTRGETRWPCGAGGAFLQVWLLPQAGGNGTATAMQGDRQGNWQSAIARAQAHSPYLCLALDRRPDIADLLGAGQGEEALALAQMAEPATGGDEVGRLLRHRKQGIALALAVGDLAGGFPLERVMQELSLFADRALDASIAEAIRRRVPDETAEGFFAIALGKHGAGELNYSSDIDPILLFDPAILPRSDRDDPGEAAQRYARTIMDLMSTQTAEGYVFRVDLRLRPASEASPLAISVNAALSHYESSALAWERAAYIRARAAAGDIAAGEGFLVQIRPFVWRRSLDFTAIEEIRRLTGRIREAYRGPLEPGPGFDLKRGRGGIREIEFFAQTHQLIYGGRHPALRSRRTRAALDALAGEGLIPPETAAMLGTAYDRLRVVEHRLQMVDDRQTHTLPADPAALDNVARLDGLPDGAALVAELRAITAEVAACYGTLLGQGEASAARTAQGPVDSELAARAEGWRGTMRALRSAEARVALDAILPDLLAVLGNAPDPDHAVVRWETLLEKVPTAVNLFRLFEQRPGLLEQVLRILTLARPLADELARHPDRLDALIDHSVMDLPGPVGALAERMRRSEPDDDYEHQLDRIRRVVGEERFAMGVQLIEGHHDPLDIAAGLSRIAEAALQVAAEAAGAEFARAHGTIPGDALLVLGLGRFGGGALTHASDLDVIYLHAGDGAAESDGRRPLPRTLYFNRLAQRVTVALSVPTADGALYEVDTRLRPMGKQGPIAVTLDSFRRYELEDAWTWEHMALCRARVLLGPPEARDRLEAILAETLAQPRDPAALRTDVLTMRAEMASHKHPAGPLDAKLLRGGLVDCEFIIHYLQLRERTAFHPALANAIDALVAQGLLPAAFPAHYRLLARLLVSARLLAPEGAAPHDTACAALARACQQADYPALLQALSSARKLVAGVWADLFDEKLEIA
jgi:glutamate-ammonia-ligase adenylyltransferase